MPRVPEGANAGAKGTNVLALDVDKDLTHSVYLAHVVNRRSPGPARLDCTGDFHTLIRCPHIRLHHAANALPTIGIPNPMTAVR